MPGAELILVKHAMPDIVPDAPSRDWRLSDAGRAGSRALVRLLASYQPAVVFTSDEAKAVETGEIVASELGITSRSAPGLHEHERSAAPFLGQSEFEETMKEFFHRPDALVFGSETASDARIRFAGALEDVMDSFPGGTLVVVAHGTVISLFVSQVAGIDQFSLWRRLGLPSFVVLDRPPTRVLSIVEEVVVS